MPTPSHTPTPWFIKNGQLKGQGLTTGVLYGGNPTELWRANAAFIVKAVNCHEELVEALQETKKMTDELLRTMDIDEDHWYRDDLVGLRVSVIQALAKAEAEQ